jgi:hypothetical protein
MVATRWLSHYAQLTLRAVHTASWSDYTTLHLSPLNRIDLRLDSQYPCQLAFLSS